MERRLAAMLAADAVGYSRLMGADEEAVIAVAAVCTLFYTGLDLSAPTDPKHASLTPAGPANELRSEQPQIDDQQRQVAAAATPANLAEPVPQQANPDLPRKLQVPLSSIGCSHGIVDGVWGYNSQRALERFAKHAKLTLPSKPVSVETLSLLQEHSGRICPLECVPGQIDSNGTCVAKTCATGQFLDAASKCVTRSVESQYKPPTPVPRNHNQFAAPERKKRRQGINYGGMGVECDVITKSQPEC